MSKITVPALVKKGLIVEVDSKINPETCVVSETGPGQSRLHLTSGEHYKNGRPVGVKAVRQKSWKIVANGRIFSRYVVSSRSYVYKAQGVLFLTSLGEALVQCGFNVINF